MCHNVRLCDTLRDHSSLSTRSITRNLCGRPQHYMTTAPSSNTALSMRCYSQGHRSSRPPWPAVALANLPHNPLLVSNYNYRQSRAQPSAPFNSWESIWTLTFPGDLISKVHYPKPPSNYRLPYFLKLVNREGLRQATTFL